MSITIRNDATTLTALGGLYLLTLRHGTDIERAAIKHLAYDLGYTLIELDAAARGKRPEQPLTAVPYPPVALKAVAGGTRPDAHDEAEAREAREIAEARGSAT